MTREEYVKHLIGLQNQSVKAFALSIGIPYTTLLGMLKNGLGGAAVDNVIKVCQGLGITVDDLQRTQSGGFKDIPFFVSEREKRLLTTYRAMPQMQPAIDAILGLDQVDR